MCVPSHLSPPLPHHNNKRRRLPVNRRAAIHPTNDSTHAQQAPSNNQTNGQRRNPETVEHALSKGTAAANAVHDHRLHPFEQSADFQPNSDTMSSELCKNIRDRLGLWGTVSESEVAGNVTGLERLRSARFNKVCFPL